MKKIGFLLLVILVSENVVGQTPYFTWEWGSDDPSAELVQLHPGARSEFASWSDENGNMWLFGGNGYQNDGLYGKFNDLWYYSVDDNSWTFLSGSSEYYGTGSHGNVGESSIDYIPDARSGAKSWVDSDGNFWLFGGVGLLWYNDLWKYDPVTYEWTYFGGTTTSVGLVSGDYGTKGIESELNWPISRQRGGLVGDDNGNLFLFGGEAQNGLLNDVWKFNISSNQWTWIAGSEELDQLGIYGSIGVQAEENNQGARNHFACWYDSGTIWVFGGYGHDKSNDYRDRLNDFWKFDIASTQWTWIGGTDEFNFEYGNYGTKNVPDATNYPPYREGMAFWKDSTGKFWMFGGNVYGNSNELWVYDPDTEYWTWKGYWLGPNEFGTLGVSSPSNSPTGRRSCNAWSDINGVIRIFGGTAGYSLIKLQASDLWSFDTSSEEWTWINGSKYSGEAGIYSTDLPDQKYSIASFSDESGDLWIYGGLTGEGTSNDIWKFHTKTRIWERIYGTGLLDETGDYGEIGVPSGSNVPPARYDATIWKENDNIWMFGGSNGVAKNDFWRFNLSSRLWTWIGGGDDSNGISGEKGVSSTSNIPAARWAAASWVDNTGNFWLFGGVGRNDLWKFKPSTGEWTWISGSQSQNQAGQYGDKGISSSTNYPGARYNPLSWVDDDGIFWIFGGYGADSNGDVLSLNDLWRFDTTSGEWAWMSGSNINGQSSIYGTLGIGSVANVPGARTWSISWTDGENLWLFGGSGQRNDLWQYEISSNEWTWMAGKGSSGSDKPVYGEFRVANVTNQPGGRQRATSWTDSDGNFWLYGGYGYNSSSSSTVWLVDMWKIEFTPDKPKNVAASDITTSEFTVAWDPITGAHPADYYELDVSLYSDFSSFLPDHEAFVLTENTKLISGLSSSTEYYVRVRAINDIGPSAYAVVSQMTYTEVPVILSATSVTQNSFVINWNSVSGAENYYLEISTSSNFSTYVTGYDGTVAISGSDILSAISGLQPGTIYYYRIEAENAQGRSGVSDVKSQITLPANPTAISPINSDITSTTFKAEWNAIQGADTYELEVSGDDFATFLNGYGPKELEAINTSDVIGNLTTGSVYKYRVRAKNSAGVSGNSNIVSVVPINPIPLALSTINDEETQNEGANQTISFSASGGTAPYTVVVKYRGLLATSYQTGAPTEVSPGPYTFEITSGMLDELGLEYIVEITDASDATDTETGTIYRSYSEGQSPVIPLPKFGGIETTWNLFSIPYDLTNKSISIVFTDLDQSRHEFDWRIVRYRNSSNDYVNFNTGQNTIGEAYWFNSKEKVTAQMGAGSARNTLPFSKTLQAGWNLVGNPYPVTISWNDVLADPQNAAVSGVGSLQVFNGTTQSTGDNMAAFGGGFVWADATTSVKIDPRVTGTLRTDNARIDALSNSVDENAWVIPLFISDGVQKLKMGGFGMHPEASLSKDRFDEMAVPRFFCYTDLFTEHDYFYSRFAQDVVPTGTVHKWEFTLSSNIIKGATLLTWDNSILRQSTASLYLLDRKSGRVVDMKITDAVYANMASGDFTFEVFYSAMGDEFIPDNLILGAAYPNPATTRVTIPVLLPKWSEGKQVELVIYDINGREVKSLAKGRFAPGAYEFTWEIASGVKIGAGLYISKLRFENEIYPAIENKIILR